MTVVSYAGQIKGGGGGLDSVVMVDKSRQFRVLGRMPHISAVVRRTFVLIVATKHGLEGNAH